MDVRSGWIALVVVLLGCRTAAWPQQSCPAIDIPQPAPGANIFTLQQEAALGDAMDAGFRQTMRVVQDPALTQPLAAIGNRLAAQLPPGHSTFRITLFDSASAEAFSIPGHIYVSRKLVALSHSEDEMAGILAHELGHIAAHHSAIQATDSLHRVLNVTQVGDSADVVAKWNQFLNNYRRVKYTATDAAKAEKRERQEQEQADNIALSVVARAGYSTQAFVEVFDRIAETKGKTGNAWTDFFGTTPPDSKRLRQMAKERPPVPPDCITAHGDSIPNYVAWRAKVIEQRTEAHAENLPGLLSKRELTERLRPQVTHIRISPDGKYVLAQDDSNIYVLTRVPLKSLFRIDAPDASPAQFTPDAASVVFQMAPMGASPRVERWDIASHLRMEVHEIYVRRGCLLNNLSPDGKALSCLTSVSSDNGFSFDLDLYDTASGNSFFHKKDWVAFVPGRFDVFAMYRIAFEIAAGNQGAYDELSRVAISPDGRYLVARSLENTLAMDLSTRTPISLPGNLKDLLTYGRFTFLNDGRFMGVGGSRGDKATVVEFPSGRVVYSDILVGIAKPLRVARGDYALLAPVKDNALGVMRLTDKKIFFESKRTAFDIWDTQAIGERENGDLIAVELATAKVIESAALPDAQLGGLRAAEVSPDLNWLAVSQTSRGAVWDVQSGRRLYHLRGFLGGYFSSDGPLYADFPQHLKTDRSIVRLSLSQVNMQAIYTLGEKEHALQAGRYLVKLVPSGDNTAVNRNLTFELRDVTSQNLLWSKHISHERPGYVVDTVTNSLMLYWPASSRQVQALAKEDRDAAAKLAAFKNKDGIDYLEVYELGTGKLRFSMALDTGKNSIRISDMSAAADRLVLADTNKRLLFFGRDGTSQGAVPGTNPQASPDGTLLTARTQLAELTLYDVHTLQPLAVYSFDSSIAFSGFSADSKRLLVMTANQTIYLLDTAARGTNVVASQ